MSARCKNTKYETLSSPNASRDATSIGQRPQTGAAKKPCSWRFGALHIEYDIRLLPIFWDYQRSTNLECTDMDHCAIRRIQRTSKNLRRRDTWARDLLLHFDQSSRVAFFKNHLQYIDDVDHDCASNFNLFYHARNSRHFARCFGAIWRRIGIR